MVNQNPVDQSVTAGQSATFTASASNATSVQWQVSTDGGSTWSGVSGATSDTLTINDATLGESGNEYRAVFSEFELDGDDDSSDVDGFAGSAGGNR